MNNSGWAEIAHRFGQYYANCELWSPPRQRMREWMFIPFKGIPLRHRSHPNNHSLRQYLVERPPHSVFYSTAYWEKPHELKMIDKNWKGADLIFDLDGDHLPGVSDTDFPAMIDVIQEQAWSLWNDFLQPEFGFKEEYLHITFSGHRGFHLHYRDPSWLHLESGSRRELVSHIRGEGVDVTALLPRYHEPNATGWARRMRHGVSNMVKKLVSIHNGDETELKRLLSIISSHQDRSTKRKKWGKVSIQKLAAMLEHDDRRQRIANGRIEILKGSQRELFLALVKLDSAIVLDSAGETDEVVTIDTKRQIRFPTSLHGKCGLRVTDIPLDRLEPHRKNSFDPLTEGIALSRQKSSRIEIIKDDVVARFDDRIIEGNMGDTIDIHEAGAFFLRLKNWAKKV